MSKKIIPFGHCSNDPENLLVMPEENCKVNQIVPSLSLHLYFAHDNSVLGKLIIQNHFISLSTGSFEIQFSLPHEYK